MNCRECKHSRSIPGDTHLSCVNPLVEHHPDKYISLLCIYRGVRSGAMKKMNVSCNPHGVNNGWCMWPLNFDPIWIETCVGYEEKRPEL